MNAYFCLPCVKGGGTACRDGGIVLFCFLFITIPQSLCDSSLYTREPIFSIAFIIEVRFDLTVRNGSPR